MQNILDWYDGIKVDASPEVEQQVQQVSIEKELEKQREEQPQEDNVLASEFESCIKAIGISELLRNNLTNYLAMTQVPDLEGFKKDEMKSGIKQVLDELSNTIAEL